MKNYEDLLLERVQILTGKLAQKQREGCLTEELSLCIRLAQLHCQLDSPKISVQFWQSCMQIAADLEEEDEIWRAAAEIAKIYCKEDQIDAAEDFMREHLKVSDTSKSSLEPESLRLSLLKSEVITAMAPASKTRELSVNEFLTYERALRVLDEAIELKTGESIWWWEAVAFRAELLAKLGKYDESRFKEALDVVNAIQSGGVSGDVLMSLRCKSISSKIYFAMREYATALESAISAIDQYKSDPGNSNYRPRRRIYCEMLLLAGRALRFQKDFNFSLQNLLLSKDEAQALAVEREFMEEIALATQEAIEAKSTADEATMLQRKKNPMPKDLEDLADKFGIIGNFEGQLDLLERCRTVATSDSTRNRLDKKLIYLYFNELRNWPAVLRIDLDDWKILLLKGRACANLGRFEEAEEFLLDALRESNEALAAQAALYFYYRQRDNLTSAEKYKAESLSLETISDLKSSGSKRNCLIDPNFSYFATRKPSNSLMKMLGSGMVMRTKTRKTKGLQLKRRRGPSQLRNSTVKLKKNKCFDDSSGLSDFIVSDEYTENDKSESENENESENETKKLESTRSLIIISSSDSELEQPHIRISDKKGLIEYGLDSPLMIRTEKLDEPFATDFDSPSTIKIDFEDDEGYECIKSLGYSEDKFYDKRRSKDLKYDNSRNSQTKRVVVRFKKGIEVVIPTTFDVTVKELIKTAQMRLNRLFPEESKRLGQICGLSLNNSASAMVFPDDRLDLILSGNSETLQAHFKKQHFIESPSQMNTIEEDFKRKIQILNLKADGNSEIKFLKTFQNRFRAAHDDLNLSSLSLDSINFSEYSSFVNKFLKLSDNLKGLNLSENLLCDEDLRSLSLNYSCSCEEINLSANFLQRPNMKLFMNCDFIDFSYNPIDLAWLISNASNFKGLSLIGCFELLNEEISCDVWNELGFALNSLKKLKLSLFPEIPSRFFSNLCSGTLEEVEFFAFDWKSEILVELSYLEKLKSLNFSSCTFSRIALESLGKVLKRTSSLEKLSFNEIEFSEEDWLLIGEGISVNFSLKQVVKDDKIIEGGVRIL